MDGDGMHIGLVGGLDRTESVFPQLAKRAGHRLECHNGDLSGRGSDTLQTLVERSDVVIVVTDVNSHAAVWRARRLARSHGRRCVLMRRCGRSHLLRLFAALTEEERAAG
jgi:hypothetical protein